VAGDGLGFFLEGSLSGKGLVVGGCRWDLIASGREGLDSKTKGLFAAGLDGIGLERRKATKASATTVDAPPGFQRWSKEKTYCWARLAANTLRRPKGLKYPCGSNSGTDSVDISFLFFPRFSICWND
jgi:hypothetical protein